MTAVTSSGSGVRVHTRYRDQFRSISTRATDPTKLSRSGTDGDLEGLNGGASSIKTAHCHPSTRRWRITTSHTGQPRTSSTPTPTPTPTHTYPATPGNRTITILPFANPIAIVAPYDALALAGDMLGNKLNASSVVLFTIHLPSKTSRP